MLHDDFVCFLFILAPVHSNVLHLYIMQCQHWIRFAIDLLQLYIVRFDQFIIDLCWTVDDSCRWWWSITGTRLKAPNNGRIVWSPAIYARVATNTDYDSFTSEFCINSELESMVRSSVQDVVFCSSRTWQSCSNIDDWLGIEKPTDCSSSNAFCSEYVST